MANQASPRGLRVAGPLLEARWFEVPASYATALFIGDPVIATGTSNQVTAVTVGTAAANASIGPVIGVYDANKVPGIQASTGERLNYKPASTAAYVLVATHPRQLFIAQGDGDSSYLDKDDCGGNVPMVASTAGSTLSGQSAWKLDDSATAGSATDLIRLVRPVDRPDNTVGIAYCDWYCFINNHQLSNGTLGAGI
jgi:hypothetical protein